MAAALARRLALLLAALCLGTVPAAAQTDTVERFEEILATHGGNQILTYQTIAALGDDGVLLESVAFAPQPGAPPVTVERVLFHSLDFEAWDAGRPPAFLSVDLVGLAPAAGPLQPGGNPLALIGFDSESLDVRLDYRRTGPLTILDPLRITAPGAGIIELRGRLMSLPEDPLFAQPMAFLGAQVDEASIVFTDDGMLARQLAASAAADGRTVDQQVAAVTQGLQAVLVPPGTAAPYGSAAFAALSALLADYQAPAPLTITLAPAQPVPLLNLMGIGNFEAVAALFNLSVTYGG